LAEELGQLNEQTETLKSETVEAKKVESDGSVKVKDLEYKIKNAKQLKEKELKVIEILNCFDINSN
jgi:hypothetical protein